MIEKKVIIINKLGLHARASAKIVSVCNHYKSNIIIKFNNRYANAKSIMGIMMLSAAQNSELTLIANGEDEELAVNAIINLINNKFGENL